MCYQSVDEIKCRKCELANILKNGKSRNGEQRCICKIFKYSFQIKFRYQSYLVKDGGNSYTTFFRQLDPRLGRWLSIDPVFQPHQSPYNSMDNNPIWFNDQMGDKVGYERGDGVTKKEFRHFKREIRQMRRKSKSFEEMYNELDAQEERFIFTAKRMKGDEKDFAGQFVDKTKTEDKQHHIYINLDNAKTEIPKTIAHETGHSWRYLHNLDIEPISAPLPTPPSRVMNPFDKDANEKYNGERERYEKNRDKIREDNFVQTAEYKKSFELAALHIENIVVSELKLSRRFKDLQFSGFYINLEYYEKKIIDGKMKSIPSIIHAPNSCPEEYYRKQLDLYKENNIKRP